MVHFITSKWNLFEMTIYQSGSIFFLLKGEDKGRWTTKRENGGPSTSERTSSVADSKISIARFPRSFLIFADAFVSAPISLKSSIGLLHICYGVHFCLLWTLWFDFWAANHVRRERTPRLRYEQKHAIGLTRCHYRIPTNSKHFYRKSW